MFEKTEFTENEMFYDILAFILAGAETSSH